MIITPKVQAMARSYFNCPNVNGVELENQGLPGTKGSHWEARIIRDEIMISYSDQDNNYSPFTAAALEDSGWYKFDYSYTQLISWGRNKGCSFIADLCIDPTTKTTKFLEFCSNKQSQSCSYRGTSKGLCYTKPGTLDNPAWNYFGDSSIPADQFTDDCPYNFDLPGGDCRIPTNNVGSKSSVQEYYGPYGRCFEGSFTSNNNAMYGSAQNMACLESHVTKIKDHIKL